MKTTIILEPLVLAAALTATQVGAAPISLQGSTITGTYNDSADGMLGLDHLFEAVPGSNTTAIDPDDQLFNNEFLTGDYRFAFDFTTTGQLVVTLNLDPADLPAGDYRMRFDFGTSLSQRIGSFTLLDTSGIGSLPALSVVNDHTIAIDLSSVTWNSEYSQFSTQIGAATAAVPEPGSIGLALAGMAGLALTRRRSGTPGAQR
ncbi:PEP-CTERM sorting domain-containing protein [Massilia consociata]|uniref:PEP-CTERM sorting domain-containing protein n=1 Tax=Massilia consociata TaxID=760117 RepID=A0ABV6FCW1_9BURK